MSQSQNSVFIKEFEKALNTLNDYRLELGVFTGKTQRKIQVGVTNAELMFLHENGSPLRNIPSRPVIQMTINHAYQTFIPQTVDECIDLILNGGTEVEIKQTLEKLAIRIENYARQIIYSNDGRLEPNAPSTIAKKGDNHPLFDTGQLARSITCRVVKV